MNNQTTVDDNDKDPALDHIAIIGMSCRFPDAKDTTEFWANLRAGHESVRKVRAEDLMAARIDMSLLDQADHVPASVILDDIDQFDAEFFGFSPRDAEILDPQQRLFLEVTWEALESSGCDPARFPGAIGVYGGVSTSQYQHQLHANPDIMAANGPFQINLGNDKDHLTTRVAYKFNLRGPAVTVQTTCSTSLVAVSQACQSLLDYQCDMALAGGSSIHLPQGIGYTYQEGGIESPDGHCRAFDARAQGTVGGSGAGVVALKRLTDALEEGDQILAVIMGSAINNDGALKVGYTAPSVDGQAEVIATAQALAGIDPSSISYIECHGTGTPLGDPIEIAALTQAFRAATDRRGFCAVGSVKTNIGHLNAAAGVAGLIKTVLAMQHRELPPSVNFESPNPEIEFAASPFFVNDRLRSWDSVTPLRAGISSFGIGGTNAHVVLQEAPPRKASQVDGAWQLLLLSARTDAALEQSAARLADHLDATDPTDLADIAWTLQQGRQAFARRRTLLCASDDPMSAAKALRSQGDIVRPLENPALIFLCTGQGSQYPGMGMSLYRNSPVYQEAFDQCSASLRPHLGLDLAKSLYGAAPVTAEQLNRTDLAQPALFAVEYATAQLWQHWGVQPQMLIGHSLGEYVAACLAGVMSLDDALSIVAARGRLMQACPTGSMLAVLMPEAEILPLLDDELCLAAVNGPGLSVIAGTEVAVTALEQHLNDTGHGCRRLHTSHAFHSVLMQPALAPLREVMADIELRPPQLPFISNLSGDWIEPEQACDPEYWVHHLRRPVRFAAGLATLMQTTGQIFLEIGPGHTLADIARSQIDDCPVMSSLPGPEEAEPVAALPLGELGRLWQLGVDIEWSALHGDSHRHKQVLPTYPFQRRRYWVDPPLPQVTAATSGTAGQRDISRFLYQPEWQPQPNLIAELSGNWLILGEDSGLDQALANRLRAAGCAAVLAIPGPDFHQLTTDRYTVQPANVDHARQLVTALAGSRPLTHVLHTWGLNAADDTPFAAVQELGLNSVLSVVRALDEQPGSEQIRFGVVTRRLHSCGDATPRLPAQGTLTGACKVIAQEHPRLRCTVIDVGEDNDDQLAEQLCADLVAPFAADTAWRDAQRHLLKYVPAVLPPTGDTPLREGGTYLISGGLGKIGLTIAELLTSLCRPKLVLIGRKRLPPKARWYQLMQDPNEPLAPVLQRLLTFEQHGAQVLSVEADMADPVAVRRALTVAQGYFGPIHGVFHAAGNTNHADFLPASETDITLCERHFDTKVHGLTTLADALADKPDFYLLTSSISTLLGGLGFTAYAAANAYMDAFARCQNTAERSRWIAVNWDGWQFESPPGLGDDSPLTAAEGSQALMQILAADTTSTAQVVVATGNLDHRLEQWVQLDALQPATTTGTSAANGISAHERPDLSTSYRPAQTKEQQVVIDIWEQLLGISPIGIDDNFFELGGHSLLAIQLVSRVRTTLDVELSVSQLFETPTPAGLVTVAETNGLSGGQQSIQRLERKAQRVAIGVDGTFQLPDNEA